MIDFRINFKVRNKKSNIPHVFQRAFCTLMAINILATLFLPFTALSNEGEIHSNHQASISKKHVSFASIQNEETKSTTDFFAEVLDVEEEETEHESKKKLASVLITLSNCYFSHLFSGKANFSIYNQSVVFLTLIPCYIKYCTLKIPS